LFRKQRGERVRQHERSEISLLENPVNRGERGEKLSGNALGKKKKIQKGDQEKREGKRAGKHGKQKHSELHKFSKKTKRPKKRTRKRQTRRTKSSEGFHPTQILKSRKERPTFNPEKKPKKQKEGKKPTEN